MRREFKVHCSDRSIWPDEVIRLFHFSHSEQQLAGALGVKLA
ncbi:hypothetical protein [Vogesella sp. LIG4]|nr:hypothetical protein [Vogesella sp. LIG4]